MTAENADLPTRVIVSRPNADATATPKLEPSAFTIGEIIVAVRVNGAGAAGSTAKAGAAITASPVTALEASIAGVVFSFTNPATFEIFL